MAIPTQALLIVAHGSRHADVVRQVRALRGDLQTALPDWNVSFAFLEHAAPDVPAALAQLAALPIEQAAIVPLLLSQANHAGIDLPRWCAYAEESFPHIRWRAAAPVGDHPAIRALSWRLLRQSTAELDTRLPWHYLFLGRGGIDPPVRYRELSQFLASRGAPPWFAETCCALLTEGDWESVLQRTRHVPLVVQPHLLFAGTLYERIAQRVAACRAACEETTCLVPALGPAPELAVAILDRVQSLQPHARQFGSRSTENFRMVP